jgi:hypothetical protein
MAFLESEVVYLNETAQKYLPNRIGEIAIVDKCLCDSLNVDYRVQFEDFEFARVKESELTRLTENQRELIKYIYRGNEVSYSPTEQRVIVSKVDLVHNQVEVNFVEGGSSVVDIDKLVPLNETEETINILEDKKTRTDLHREVIEEIHTTFKIKNADYGNSFGEQYEEYGLLSAVIRLDDKMRRLKQLMKQSAQVKDESIRDTVLDLSNYAIMTVMELDKGGLNV